jgi:hypothetical protein
VAGAALALLAVVAAPANAGTGRHSRVKVLATILTGENETAAGDADGIGVAVLRFRPATGQICYLIAVARLDTVVAAHIHRAPAGTNGPVIVPLTAPVSGVVKDCATADPALAAEIVANPAGFYVNVHTDVFPGGAVRGQLR